MVAFCQVRLGTVVLGKVRQGIKCRVQHGKVLYCMVRLGRENYKSYSARFSSVLRGVVRFGKVGIMFIR